MNPLWVFLNVGESDFGEIGQLADVPAHLPRVGDGRPVVVGVAVDRLSIALGETHTEGHVLEDGVVVEGPTRIALQAFWVPLPLSRWSIIMAQ